LFSADIIEINAEQCVLASVKDITELKRFDREMARLDLLPVHNTPFFYYKKLY
jgi:hypothetical protein